MPASPPTDQSCIARPRAAARAQPTCNRGMALMEWMIAIALWISLVGLSWPLGSGAWSAIQSDFVSQTLVHTLRIAQQEALSRSARVTVTPTKCDSIESETTPWACPWLIYIDVSGDHAFDPDKDEALRVVKSPYPVNVSSRRDYVVFGPLGSTSQVQTFAIEGGYRVVLSWSKITRERSP